MVRWFSASTKKCRNRSSSSIRKVTDLDRSRWNSIKCRSSGKIWCMNGTNDIRWFPVSLYLHEGKEAGHTDGVLKVEVTGHAYIEETTEKAKEQFYPYYSNYGRTWINNVECWVVYQRMILSRWQQRIQLCLSAVQNLSSKDSNAVWAFWS